ncbi:MFS transporter [Nocardioides sp. KR10-350]|uniref:MFS transporter n=1 Tax=Nocardioides cheoyonin TaxID=3156615 RepID=UPI0032B4CF29
MSLAAPPSARPATPRARHFALAVLALAVGGFAIGTTEFVTMGVLPQISGGVDVSKSTAGHLISAYALGVVVGVPLLSFFVTGLPRKGLLIALMGVYALFNALSAAATGYHLLLVARFLDGLPHGAYFGVASLVAAGMADPRRKGRAVAMVMLGLSVANVVGVPAATWLGQHLGWRAPYAVAAGLSLLTVLLVQVFVPHVPGDRAATGRGEARRFFTNPQVWLTMAAGAIGFGGMFAVYSYIAYLVTDTAHLPESTVPWFVLAFGLGMVVGTWLAGELARWSVFGSLLVGGVGMALALVGVWFVAPHGWWLWPASFLMTGLSSVLVLNLQLRLMDVAGDAVTLGAAMNHAALNIANALGAFLGGAALDVWGERSTPLVGAVLAAAGTVVLLWSRAAHRRAPALD